MTCLPFCDLKCLFHCACCRATPSTCWGAWCKESSCPPPPTQQCESGLMQSHPVFPPHACLTSYPGHCSRYASAAPAVSCDTSHQQSHSSSDCHTAGANKLHSRCHLLCNLSCMCLQRTACMQVGLDRAAEPLCHPRCVTVCTHNSPRPFDVHPPPGALHAPHTHHLLLPGTLCCQTPS
jgi:hypothetical protein